MQRTVEEMSCYPGDLGEMVGLLLTSTGKCLEEGLGGMTVEAEVNPGDVSF